jgi:photosystem II stability/assembly factor-like uncharacterized protein
MKRFAPVLLIVLGSALQAGAANPPVAAGPARLDVSLLKAMQWREIGPYRGGRAAAVEGIRTQPDVYYFGATGGGVWKTTDGGASWQSVSDGFFGGSIGSVAVAPSDPNIVYVGGGEVTVRGNVSHGDGVWKSTDAGKSWTRTGLEDSRQIPRIRIHPNNPDLVYAAVLGHVFGPNDMRGVYRSRDGGRNWERILFVNRDSGAVDLAMDPANPRILYASLWRFRRTPYSFESGGEGSGLWKSTDGGDTWKELSHNKGLPKGPLGIIGVSVSASNPQNVYAIVEANEGGVFRSRDGGDTWEKTNDSRELRQRAWYYSRIYADPKDDDTVYVVNVRFHKSKDGGKTFSAIPTPHGDNHDLWIAPDQPNRMIEANDGGVNVSTDGGASWTRQDNQPTAQIYRLSTDNDFPYRLLGAQQDNSALRIRNRSTGSGIGPRDWEETAGGESGYIVADPKNPDIVYGGSYGGLLTVVNHRTEESRDVNPWPDNPMGWGAADLKHRFQWNFPMFFSPNDPKKLYVASQYLLQSTDGGASWKTISADLTRNDKSKMAPSGGPITRDNTSVEYYGTVFAAAESPKEPGVLWAGSDDGLLHVSRDGGQSWSDVTPKDMPQWIMINSIEPSPYENGGAYVAATMYKWDDFRPYLYRTSDYGKTWTKITDGIPADQFTRVVRADPKRQGLLFAGTERGVWMSPDEGAHWQPIQLKLPIVPITDMLVRDDSLVVATQGRGFWMLDNLGSVRQLTPELASETVHLFVPSQAWRLDVAQTRRAPRNQGSNPPDGVVVDYYLSKQKPGTKVSLAFLGPDGKLIREYKGEVEAEGAKPKELKAADVSKLAAAAQTEPHEAIKSEGGAAEKNPSATPEEEAEKPKADDKKEEDKLTDLVNGHNRFAWNLRYPDAKKFEGMVLWGGGTSGPRVFPGMVQVRLTVGDQQKTVPLEVRQEPRTSASAADLKAQFDFVLGVHDKLSEVNEQITRIREVRKELGDVKKTVGDSKEGKPIITAASDLDKKMTVIEEALYQTKNRSPQDPLNFPVRLNDKLAAVGDSAASGTFAPTAQQIAVRVELGAAIDAQLAKLKAIWDTDVPAFNKLVHDQNVPAVK